VKLATAKSRVRVAGALVGKNSHAEWFASTTTT